MARTKSPLSRREVLKFGAFTTVGGVLTPGISTAQAVVTDTTGITARDIQLNVKGTSIPGYEARPEAPVSASIGRAQYLGDIRAAADHAKAQSWARADRIGVTGFCGGGALTLHFTADNPDVTAAVPWYGHLKRVYHDVPGVDAFRPQVYKKDAADDAWKRCLAFFDKHLKA
jgi:cephalosporin-C deacetylase-like acetyl esterase